MALKQACDVSENKGKKKMRTDPRTNQASMFVSSKWKRQQTGVLADLTEEKHFEIRVDIGNKDECVPLILCLLCHCKCVAEQEWLRFDIKLDTPCQ